MARPQIAWFTPLQPIESGISLYSEDLLPILSSVMNIDVFIEGYAPTNLSESRELHVHDFRSFDPRRYDLTVYQVGNSPAHLFMLPEISRTPGLLVLHDTVLNHLMIQQAARNGTLLRYRDDMVRRYGAEAEPAADRVLKGQAPDDLFRFPMSETLVESSRATVVHSEFARRDVLSRSPSANVSRVPHGLRIPEYVDQAEARSLLGWPADQFTIVSITHINPHKRIDVVLRAFKRLRQSVPARLILAGSVSPNFPLNRMINHLGLDQVVDTPGYVTDREARLIAAAADVIVNLRFPTAGETSGSLLHSMAAGRPVLVSETGSFKEVPGDAVVRIPVDALEEAMLVAAFERLAYDRQLWGSLGERARCFIVENHSLQRWADGYVEVISSLIKEEITLPRAGFAEEPITEGAVIRHGQNVDDLTSELARDVAELGLGGDEELLAEIALARVELGLGVGMISLEGDRQHERRGGSHDGAGSETDQ